MVGERDGLWAGIPMPLDEEQLVIEPKYPRAAELMAIGAKSELQAQADNADVLSKWGNFRNKFYSSHKRCWVVIFDRDGRAQHAFMRETHPMSLVLRTLGCSDAWGIEQETRALQLLAGLLNHNSFKRYLLTGMFLERSKRSGVLYIFRKLRPTIALHAAGEDVEIMCTLCQHPIAYYAGSFAGAMCPTDDVIAALQMMRADEARFWRTSNQHPAWVPESGVFA